MLVRMSTWQLTKRHGLWQARPFPRLAMHAITTTLRTRTKQHAGGTTLRCHRRVLAVCNEPASHVIIRPQPPDILSVTLLLNG